MPLNRSRIRHAFGRFRLAGAVAAAGPPIDPEPEETGFVTYADGSDTGYAVTDQGERITYDPLPEN